MPLHRGLAPGARAAQPGPTVSRLGASMRRHEGPRWSGPGNVPEAAACAVAATAALTIGKISDLDKLRPQHRCDQQLSDPVPPVDRERRRRVGIQQVDQDLPRYPASIVPGAFTMVKPCRAASPERG